ncbi:hypothetical protein D1J36_002445 [Riemerella anatipestifer]|uniref:hypothetical protein n=1 Tax=Riemerella anatipestifer TaxID=34085 RepID=UPI0012AE141E|nr:hypothetical protein [Riemerella anatipestifer]USL95988.1 hypothetical protein D1J36_002445 [Riemerella anatipestifer]
MIKNSETENNIPNPLSASKKNSWLQTTISIIIGVVFTIGTTWYTIYINKEEAERSELERYNKVKENLVSIIEEHIVNKDSIDFISLNRIINNRIKEENLYKKPEIIDLLSLAEYNIQNSRHLSFDKKIEYSRILSKQFRNIKIDTTLLLDKVRFPEEIKNLNENLNNINSSNGKETLIKLINKYENEITDLQEKKIKKESLADYFFKSPTRIIIIFAVYAGIMLFYLYYVRLRRRKRLLYEHRYEIYELEAQKIREEIDYLISKANDEKTSDKERFQLNERIDYLFDKLKKTDIDYR